MQNFQQPKPPNKNSSPIVIVTTEIQLFYSKPLVLNVPACKTEGRTSEELIREGRERSGRDRVAELTVQDLDKKYCKLLAYFDFSYCLNV